jgi:tRNA(adenine34) deaminase
MSTKSWLAEALKLAHRAASEDEVPVGAVVVHDGKIIGRGYNRREQDHDPLAHAEILAIREATQALESWRLNECILVVTLEPCPMCLAACQQARIGEVYYGAKDPKGGALSLGYPMHEDPKTNHRFEVHYVEEPSCGAVLSEFFSKKRKQK